MHHTNMAKYNDENEFLQITEIRYSILTPFLFMQNFLVQNTPLKIIDGCSEWAACQKDTGWAYEQTAMKNFGQSKFTPSEAHSKMEEQPFDGIFKYDQFDKKNEPILLWKLNMYEFIRERHFWSDRVYHDERDKSIP